LEAQAHISYQLQCMHGRIKRH